MRSVAGKPGALVQEWFEQTLKSYPGETARFLRAEPDPFRNPVGHTIREGLGVLCEEIFGQMDESRISAALEGIVKLRAVEGYSAGQAAGFLFPLKKLLRQSSPEADLAELESRIDWLAQQAAGMYGRCRERIVEIQAREARRRRFVPERMRLKRGDAP